MNVNYKDLLEVTKYDEAKIQNLVLQRRSWAHFYHLSYMRENLADFLPVSEDDVVLELGAECGAITAALAKKAKNVVCVEWNKSKCEVFLQRHRNRKNVQLVHSTIETFWVENKKQYDWVIVATQLIPIATFLRENSISEKLSAKGRIALATENRLGLKYWAGCKDPIKGEIFAGIQGEKTCFSKSEFVEFLHSLGDFEWEMFYPYPDHLFPITFYSDERLPLCGELDNNFRNFEGKRYAFFDEKKAFDSLIQEGVFPTFSNSFLAVSK